MQRDTRVFPRFVVVRPDCVGIEAVEGKKEQIAQKNVKQLRREHNKTIPKEALT